MDCTENVAAQVSNKPSPRFNSNRCLNQRGAPLCESRNKVPCLYPRRASSPSSADMNWVGTSPVSECSPGTPSKRASCLYLLPFPPRRMPLKGGRMSSGMMITRREDRVRANEANEEEDQVIERESLRQRFQSQSGEWKMENGGVARRGCLQESRHHHDYWSVSKCTLHGKRFVIAADKPAYKVPDRACCVRYGLPLAASGDGDPPGTRTITHSLHLPCNFKGN